MNKRLGEVRASEGSQGIKNRYQSTLSWEASHERVLFCTEAGCFSSPVLKMHCLRQRSPCYG